MNKNISIRLFCEVTLTVGERINLETEQSHYLKNVMRCKIGEKILDDAYSMESMIKRYSKKNIKCVKVD